QRVDHEGPFAWLADLPHSPWLAQPEFALEQLAERLQTYQVDCRQLLELDEQIRHLLGEIHISESTTKAPLPGWPTCRTALGWPSPSSRWSNWP
ncbi:hypothetical protein, partial [Enterobacter hormaechei]|uniref:hypothetical protein n=1 Tax=Enterobacter hormaechei TaxID=158836 RepID=UPI00197AA7EB